MKLNGLLFCGVLICWPALAQEPCAQTQTPSDVFVSWKRAAATLDRDEFLRHLDDATIREQFGQPINFDSVQEAIAVLNRSAPRLRAEHILESEKATVEVLFPTGFIEEIWTTRIACTWRLRIPPDFAWRFFGRGESAATTIPHGETPLALPFDDEPDESYAKASPDPLAPGSVGYYFAYYGPEWAINVAILGVQADRVANGGSGSTPPWIAIGPDVVWRKEDVTDSRLDDVIGAPILREKVDNLSLLVGATSILGLGTIIDGAVRQDFHHTHNFLLGGMTSFFGTGMLTEGLKLITGRLRPDFRERYLRYTCQEGAAPKGVNCGELLADGFRVSREMLADGTKSFPSGHASTSFGLASYLSMHLGSNYLWGKDADALSMPFAAIGIGGILGAAGFVAGTRVEDNRHHMEDVLVGSALGLGTGVASYFLHFDVDGNATWRGISVAGGPGGSQGVTVSGKF